MTLTVELPNDLASHADPAREALEALAVEAFRSGSLTHHEAASMVGMGRMAFDDLLKRRGVTDHFYGVEDLLEDIRLTDAVRESENLRS